MKPAKFLLFTLLPLLLAGALPVVAQQSHSARSNVFELDLRSQATGLPADLSDSIPTEDGWFFTSWFGSFNASHAPWIFHAQHGWLYLIEGNPNGFFIWDNGMESFLWTSESIYPSMYRFSDGTWIFYQKGSKNPRNFVDLVTGVWERW